MKQILEFIGLGGCATGVIGGILLSILGADYWYVAIGIAILTYAAFPRIKEWWDDINELRKQKPEVKVEEDE